MIYINYKKILILSTIFVLIFSFSINAENQNWSVTDNISKNEGYVKYTINDETQNWQSILEFPLDYFYYNLNIKKRIDYKYLKEINLNYSENISQPENEFKDSDWIGINFSEEPNIYAETKAEMDYINYDINLIIDKFSKNNFYFGGGYSYSKRNYLMTGGYQINYMDQTFFKFEENQKVIEYNIKTYKPYLQLALITNYSPISINGKIKYSPYIKIKDFDNHFLRNKTARGSTNGYSFDININTEIKIKDNLKIITGYNYSYFKAKGVQTQTFQDGTKANVNLENKLNDYSLNLGISYKY